MARIIVVDGNALVTITPNVVDTEDSNKIVGKGNPQEFTIDQLAAVLAGKITPPEITVTLTGAVTGSGTGTDTIEIATASA